jgi:uncharacterized protein
MKNNLKEKLIKIARQKTKNNDASHDIEHALRVLKNTIRINEQECGDLDILIPAALFHDVVIYPKNHPKSKMAPDESATLTKEILSHLKEFPKNKIESVCAAIKECSFRKNSKPDNIETIILRDADRLEASGIIAIMRTFASTGHMGISFYEPNDPFCEKRKPNAMKYGLDLFYERLLIIEDKVYTDTAKEIAAERSKFLKVFLDELRNELNKI